MACILQAACRRTVPRLQTSARHTVVARVIPGAYRRNLEVKRIHCSKGSFADGAPAAETVCSDAVTKPEEGNPVSNKEVPKPEEGNLFASLASSGKLVARTTLPAEIISQVFSFLHSLPQDAPFTSYEQNTVLDMAKVSAIPPREALFRLAKESHRLKRFIPPSADRELLHHRLLEVAWNDGKDDGVLSAGYHLVAARIKRVDESSPAVPLSEALSIADTMIDGQHRRGHLLKAQLLVQELVSFPESDAQLREAFQEQILATLVKAAEHSHGPSTYYLGELYALGTIFKRNGRHAEAWWTKAAEFGSMKAAMTLASVYTNHQNKAYGIYPLFPRSRSKALIYMDMLHKRIPKAARRAAHHYYLDSPSSLPDIVQNHERKWGVLPDDGKAAYYFTVGSLVHSDPISIVKLVEMLVLDRAPIPDASAFIQREIADPDDLPDADRIDVQSDDRTNAIKISLADLANECVDGDPDPRAVRMRKLKYAARLMEHLKTFHKAMWRDAVQWNIIVGGRIGELMQNLEDGGSGMLDDLDAINGRRTYTGSPSPPRDPAALDVFKSPLS